VPLIGFIGGLLKPFALKLLMGLAIAGAVAAVLLGARNAGRNAERVAGMKRQLDATRSRDETDRRTARLDDAAVHERLLDRWSRR
jgi:hypothetical protein